jgi:hypothetical protein
MQELTGGIPNPPGFRLPGLWEAVHGAGHQNRKGVIPIATFRWRGNGAGTKTAWNDGRNWVNEADAAYAQAVYPGVNNDGYDEVFLDAAVAAAANALAGYDASALSIRSLRVSDSYNQDVASSGTYLKLTATDLVIDSGSASHVFIWASAVTTCTVTADHDVALKGTFDTLTMLKGTIALDAALTVSTAINIGYLTSIVDDVTLTIPNVTSLPATVNAHGGTIACSEPITNLNIIGAAWTQVTGDVTTLTLRGGTFNWTAGNIGTAYLYGGSLDAAGGAAPRRIGTAYIYPSASCLLDNGQNNILITSFIENLGGTVTYPAGYQNAPYMTTSYAGATDANIGIEPQTLNSGATASDATTAINVGPQDRVDFYCICAGIAAGGSVVFHVEDSATSGGAYVDIATKTETFHDDDDTKTRRIAVWGYEMNAGAQWVKLTATAAGAADCVVACVPVKSTF